MPRKVPAGMRRLPRMMMDSIVGLCSSSGGAAGAVGFVSFGGCWPGWAAGRRPAGPVLDFQLKLPGRRLQAFLLFLLGAEAVTACARRRRILRFLIRRRILRNCHKRQPQNQCQGGSSQPIQLPSKSRHTHFHLFQVKAIPPRTRKNLRQSDARIPPGVGRNVFCTRKSLAPCEVLPDTQGQGVWIVLFSGRDNRGDSP